MKFEKVFNNKKYVRKIESMGRGGLFCLKYQLLIKE